MQPSLGSALRLAVAAALALTVAGCFGGSGSSDLIQSTGSGGPVGEGVNVTAGTNEDFIVNVGRRLYFREGSAELSEEARQTLDKQAAWLARYPSWRVKIEGFADEAGSADFNRQLGMKRAE